MAGFASALSIAGTGLSIFGQLQAGQQAAEASQHNAALFQQQASQIKAKRKVITAQANRQIRNLEGEIISNVALSGFNLSGSMLEVLNDRLTQAELDKQIRISNLDIEKVQAESRAEDSRRKASRARTSSFVRAGTTLLTEGNEWYQKYGGFGTVKPKGKPLAPRPGLA